MAPSRGSRRPIIPIAYTDPFGLCPKDAGGDGKSEVYTDCAKGTSGYYANNGASGEGGLVNDLQGAYASCKESTSCSTIAAVGSMVVGGIAMKAAGRLLGASEAAGATGEITGATKHGLNQIINRGVKPGEILDAVKNGEGIRAVDALGRVSFKWVGETATVILNGAGKIITAYPGGW